MKILSILICTMPRRNTFFQRLMASLKPQLNDDVELKAVSDDGKMSIGEKRNTLLDAATGEYIAFIDDDDLVSNDYVQRILEAVKTKPDCVGMEGIITFDGQGARKFVHSLRYREWFEKDGIYYRNPNHLSPVKREHAIKVKFPDINMGEDHDYSKRLLPLLSTEVYLDNPIYFYECRSNKTV
jgi:glycosyltransferase involved in cell wall biosynthesis